MTELRVTVNELNSDSIEILSKFQKKIDTEVRSENKAEKYFIVNREMIEVFLLEV